MKDGPSQVFGPQQRANWPLGSNFPARCFFTFKMFLNSSLSLYFSIISHTHFFFGSQRFYGFKRPYDDTAPWSRNASITQNLCQKDIPLRALAEKGSLGRHLRAYLGPDGVIRVVSWGHDSVQSVTGVRVKFWIHPSVTEWPSAS